MPRYIIRFKANPAAWPTDPAALVGIWEGVIAGGNRLLADGTLSEIGWISNTEGYALLQAPSKDVALGVATPFFPFFSQEIDEAVPWEKGAAAILGGARTAAGK